MKKGKGKGVGGDAYVPYGVHHVYDMIFSRMKVTGRRIDRKSAWTF